MINGAGTENKKCKEKIRKLSLLLFMLNFVKKFSQLERNVRESGNPSIKQLLLCLFRIHPDGTIKYIER